MVFQPKTFQEFRPATFQEQERQGFFEQTAEDLGERQRKAQEALQAYQQDRISSPELALQVLGQSTGGVGDVTGNVLVSGARGIDELTGGVSGDALSSGVSGVLSLPSWSEGRTIGDVLGEYSQEAIDAYGEFSEEYPRASRNIEAATNIALFGAPALKLGKQAAKGTKALSRRLRGLDTPDSGALKSQAQALYKTADEQGGMLKPEFTDEYIRQTQKITPQTVGGQVIGGQDEATRLAERVTALEGRPLSLAETAEMDEALGALAQKAVDPRGGISDEGRKLLEMQQKLRTSIEQAPEEMFVGGREGFEATKEARDRWSAYLRMQDIEQAAKRADISPNEAGALQSGLRSIAGSPKRRRGYTPQELKLMEDVAKTGFGERALGFAGSGLIPAAAAGAGGIVGGDFSSALMAAAPAFAMQRTAQAGAGALKKAQVDRLKREIARRAGDVPKTRGLIKEAVVPSAQILSPISTTDMLETMGDQQVEDYMLKKRLADVLRGN